jgi:signal peptidase I
MPEGVERKAGRRQFVKDYVKSVFFAIFLAVLIRATLVQAYHIPSGSMEDTLLEGDYVLGDKVTFGTQIPDRLPILNLKLPSFRMPGFRNPQSGDLVIFEFPEDPSRDFIKRCVAVAGQTVEIREKTLYVDGVAYENPPGVKYLDGSIRPRKFSSRDNYGPYVVPPGTLFVMGDNRDNSYDSRFWGTVSLSKVKAHPLVIYFSTNPDSPLWNFFTKIRWGRLGKLVS